MTQPKVRVVSGTQPVSDLEALRVCERLMAGPGGDPAVMAALHALAEELPQLRAAVDDYLDLVHQIEALAARLARTAA